MSPVANKSTDLSDKSDAGFKLIFPPSHRARLVAQRGFVVFVDRIKCALPSFLLSHSNPAAVFHLAHHYDLEKLATQTTPVVATIHLTFRDPENIEHHVQEALTINRYDRLRANPSEYADLIAAVAAKYNPFNTLGRVVNVNLYPRCHYVIWHPFRDFYRITVTHTRDLVIELNDCLQTTALETPRFWLRHAIQTCVARGVIEPPSEAVDVNAALESLLTSARPLDVELAFDFASTCYYSTFSDLIKRYARASRQLSRTFAPFAESTLYQAPRPNAQADIAIYHKTLKDRVDLGQPIPANLIDAFQRSAATFPYTPKDHETVQVYRFELRLHARALGKLPANFLDRSPYDMVDVLVKTNPTALKRLFRFIEPRDRWATFLPPGNPFIPVKTQEFSIWFTKFLACLGDHTLTSS
jgi:hypothetical protein